METVLITAFEAFNQDEENPTESILALIPDFLYNAKVIKKTLPVVYGDAFNAIEALIEKEKPKVILMLGLAAGRTHISLERIAINCVDAKIPDNKGIIISNTKIIETGEDGFMTNLPLDILMKRLRQKKLPVSISNTAGTYVCNQLMYQVLHKIKQEKLASLAGFIHVPYLPHQVLDKPTTPSLQRSLMVDALMTIIDELINPLVTPKP